MIKAVMCRRHRAETENERYMSRMVQILAGFGDTCGGKTICHKVTNACHFEDGAYSLGITGATKSSGRMGVGRRISA
jgi:hypothetical protein